MKSAAILSASAAVWVLMASHHAVVRPAPTEMTVA